MTISWSMKAYLAIKYYPDNANRLRIEGISAALESCGFETVCIARDVEPGGGRCSLIRQN